MSIQQENPFTPASVPSTPSRASGRNLDEVLDAIAHRLRDASVTIEVWRQAARQRRALARLDQRMLEDIGLNEDQVRREIQRPFWDV